MARSKLELFALEFEAERLVRSGVSRADVARQLGVHPQTLAGWALRGGWRRKDIEAERSAETTTRTLGSIAAAHARRGRQAEADRLLREIARTAVGLMAAAEGRPGPELAALLAELDALAGRTRRLDGPDGWDTGEDESGG